MALGAKKSVCPSNDVASRFSTLSWLRHVKKAIWGQHPAAATRVVLLDSVSPPPSPSSSSSSLSWPAVTRFLLNSREKNSLSETRETNRIDSRARDRRTPDRNKIRRRSRRNLGRGRGKGREKKIDKIPPIDRSIVNF